MAPPSLPSAERRLWPSGSHQSWCSRTQGGPFMSLRPAEHRAVLSCPFGQQNTGRSFHVPSACRTQGGPFMSLRPAVHRAVLSCPFGQQYTGRSFHVPSACRTQGGPFMSLRPAVHREVLNNNNVHLSCAHQPPERSHDTY